MKQSESRRDILVVVPSLFQGGTETHLLRVLPPLVQNGFQVVVFPLLEEGELAKPMRAGGVHVVHPWMGVNKKRSSSIRFVMGLILNSFQLWFHMLWARPKVAHFFLPLAYLIGAPLAMASGIRCLIMSRRSLNDYQSSYPGFIRKAESFLHRRMSMLTGNCRLVTKQLIEEGALRERCLVLFNGVEENDESVNSQRAITCEMLGIDLNVTIIIIVANLFPCKGHSFLIKACRILESRDFPPWTLLVVGNDSAGIKENLEGLAFNLGLHNRIKFLGQRNDIPRLLKASDIGILCSVASEGFSNAVLESMAAGLPMVATNIGGNSEVVLDGKTGYIVPPYNSLALANAIGKLLVNPELRTKMGNAGKERVRTVFSLEECVENYKRFYEVGLGSQNPHSLKGLRPQDHGI